MKKYRLSCAVIALLLLAVLPITPIMAQSGGTLQPITPANAAQLKQIAMFGRGTIFHLAWSPDGKLIATAGSAGIWLYDVTDPQSVPRLLTDHTASAGSVSFAADGATLISSDGLNAYLWNLENGTQTTVIQAYKPYEGQGIYNAVLSPDGNLLITLESSGGNSLIVLHDLGANAQHILYNVPNDPGSNAELAFPTFSPDGQQIIVYTSFNTIREWDVHSAQELSAITYFCPEGSVYQNRVLAYNATMDRAICQANDHSLQIWDFSTSSVLGVIAKKITTIRQVTLSADSKLIATVEDKPTYAIRIWDMVTTSQGALLTGYHDTIMAAGFSPDGHFLASGGIDGVLHIWNVTANREYASWSEGHTAAITGLAFSPDGTMLASLSSPSDWRRIDAFFGYDSLYDTTLRLWNLKTGTSQILASARRQATTRLDKPLNGLVFGQKFIAFGTLEGTVRLWDLTQNKELTPLIVGAAVTDLALSRDEQLLASASGAQIVMWDTVSKTRLTTLPKGSQTVAFTQDDQWLLSDGALWKIENGARRVSLWTALSTTQLNTPIPETVKTDPAALNAMLWVQYSGGTLNSTNTLNALFAKSGACCDNALSISGVQSRQQLFYQKSYSGLFMKAAFSPDGKLLATGDRNGVIRLWGIPDY